MNSPISLHQPARLYADQEKQTTKNTHKHGRARMRRWWLAGGVVALKRRFFRAHGLNSPFKNVYYSQLKKAI